MRVIDGGAAVIGAFSCNRLPPVAFSKIDAANSDNDEPPALLRFPTCIQGSGVAPGEPGALSPFMSLVLGTGVGSLPARVRFGAASAGKGGRGGSFDTRFPLTRIPAMPTRDGPMMV